jgi:hypothetical protein
MENPNFVGVSWKRVKICFISYRAPVKIECEFFQQMLKEQFRLVLRFLRYYRPKASSVKKIPFAIMGF